MNIYRQYYCCQFKHTILSNSCQFKHTILLNSCQFKQKILLNNSKFKPKIGSENCCLPACNQRPLLTTYCSLWADASCHVQEAWHTQYNRNSYAFCLKAELSIWFNRHKFWMPLSKNLFPAVENLKQHSNMKILIHTKTIIKSCLTNIMVPKSPSWIYIHLLVCS